MAGYGAWCGGGGGWGCGWGSPYGKGYGKGKKGKGKGGAGPVAEKPMVNPNQINPAKEPMDGGISFKNILQEKIAKQLHRTIQPGDLVYTCEKTMGGRHCTLMIPALGAEHIYKSAYPGRDEKHAGLLAAADATEKIFPEVFNACLLAHVDAKTTGGAANPEAHAAIDPHGEPKGMLNGRLSLAIGRQLAVGDIVYTTTWDHAQNGYVSSLKIQCMGEPIQEYMSDPSPDQKAAEKNAARKALDANKELFDQAAALGALRKAQLAQKQSGYKGSSKGFGKSSFGSSFGRAPAAAAPMFSPMPVLPVAATHNFGDGSGFSL